MRGMICKGKMLIGILLLALCMTFIPSTPCSAAGTKNITIKAGESRTVKAGKKLSKTSKTKKIKWKITKGRKYIKLKSSWDKRSAVITGKKMGRALVTLTYKGKKKQQYLVTVMSKDSTDDEEDENSKKEEKQDDDDEDYTKNERKVREEIPLTAISVTTPDHALDWNETFVPTVTKIPANACAKDGYDWCYLYSSDDEKVVEVSEDGRVLKAVGLGEATIEAKVYEYEAGMVNDEIASRTYKGISTTFKVTVSYDEYKPKYHYQIFPIHPEFTATNDGTYFYYLKTDNPDGTTIFWNVEGPDGGQNKPKVVKGTIGPNVPDVLDLGVEVEHRTATYPNGYTREYDSDTNIVPGGYILSFSRREFDITSLDKLGTFKINIFEKNVEKLGDEKGDTSDPRLYAKAYDYSVEVIDSSIVFDREADRIVKEVYEKINDENYRRDAVCCRNTVEEGTVYSDKEENREFWIKCGIAAWLIHSEYSYGSGLESGTTTDMCANTWYSKNVTCWGASTLMCKVAQKLGAEEEYYYYTGSKAHRNARIVYNGEIVDFNATPLLGKYNYYSVENGETIYVTYDMIDYSDPRFKADWE